MPQIRKRRAPVEDDEDDIPEPTQTQHYEQEDLDDDGYGDEQTGSSSLAQLSKSLVRYALACEYSRTPIKRQDVTQKVLGSHSRMFKQVFDAANAELLDTFGMELAELPNREKVTMRQKRSAAASESQNKSSGQWVLRNALPDKFRTSNIIEPPRIPTAEIESNYVGFYTMVIALITLNGGQLSESKLDRYLRRMNANQSTPMDTTEKVFARMVKEGYIVKIKDSSSGEEIVDFVVGPRGKVEVGTEGVANMVRTVYGQDSVHDLEQRLSRSLGVVDASVGHDGGGPPATQASAVRRPGRPRRRAAEDDEDE
ncbi:MAGE-domain-containing protein [Aaosphaeria arxii CBS 175.79]|uniref:MAGE-domain-containing protein n=1 Tax=Aaosphaeria arxii CBS 175.79 TaxID=1450172 RepID=A0A6A5Y4M5_9PLEO|nr:MAGE-domain-containing protein [Aaosphaeria arxii CBS 175.79]KAF2020458.1 MAGE-domain-containing protein [Aaosphaeria arxii CBS 175.79]